MPKKHEKEMIEYFLKIIDQQPISEIVEQAKRDGIEGKYNVNITRDSVRYIINKYDIKKEKYVPKKKYDKEMVNYFKKIASEKTRKEIVDQAKKDKIDEKYGIDININTVAHLEREYGIKTKKKKYNKYSNEFIEYIRKIAVGRNAIEIYEKTKEEKAEEKYGIKISLDIIREILIRYKIDYEQIQNKYTKEALKELIEIGKETKTTKKALEVIKERKIEEKYGIEMNERKINQLMHTHKIKRKKFYSAGEERTSKDGTTFIKIEDENGKMKYITKGRYVWEEKNGKLPEGMAVMHLDGDKTNDDIKNLYPIKRETMSALNANKLVFTDKEKTKAGIMVAEMIKAKIRAENKLKKRRKMKKMTV